MRGIQFIQNRITSPILRQLREGITPKKIALSIALGCAIGIFPIFGITSLLCAIVAYMLRLNQPFIQIFNHLVAPIQILCIPIFVRTGEQLFGAEHISFSVLELKDQFFADPIHFMERFGWAGIHGMVAWILIAPLVTWTIYFFGHRILKSSSERWGEDIKND